MSSEFSVLADYVIMAPSQKVTVRWLNKTARVFLFASLLIISDACNRPPSFTEVKKDRATLFDGIQSYQSPQEFEQWLTKKALRIDGTRTENSLKPGDKRPPFQFTYVTLNDYSLNQCGGKLEVTFFNGRLMQVAFFPSNHDCLESLMKMTGLSSANKETSVGRFASAVLINSVDGRTFVTWEDTRLSSEVREWIKRYS